MILDVEVTEEPSQQSEQKRKRNMAEADKTNISFSIEDGFSEKPCLWHSALSKIPEILSASTSQCAALSGFSSSVLLLLVLQRLQDLLQPPCMDPSIVR